MKTKKHLAAVLALLAALIGAASLPATIDLVAEGCDALPAQSWR